MRIGSWGSGTCHAPEFTRQALVAAYVTGADVLRLPLRLTSDGYVVVFLDATTVRVTGTNLETGATSLSDLRKLDVGTRFVDGSGKPFKYAARVESLGLLLDALPSSTFLLLDFQVEADPVRRAKLVENTAAAIRNRERARQTVACSPDANVLAAFRPLANGGRTALVASGQVAPQIAAQAVAARADGVVLGLDQALRADLTPTPAMAAALAAAAAGDLALGVIVAAPGRLAPERAQALAEMAAVWALMIESPIEAARVLRPGWLWIDEKWSHSAAQGQDVDTHIWRIGYAKYSADRACHVYPDAGIHVAIDPYAGRVAPGLAANQIEARLDRLTERSWDALRDWPFYAGGGAGLVPAIEGDFSAEVDITSATAQQATTVEMAALNVDPGAHVPPWTRDQAGNPVPNQPKSFRDKHTFYDPHGAPPYVGVEHDENDGWRINWNLGTDYDSNQYGPPAGDGTLLTGRMRLDRRGRYFAAFMRNVGGGPLDWVCVGVIRNDSLNPRVHLRLAGKRWRQEDPADPTRYMPVIPNHFTFRSFTLRRFFSNPSTTE
jgi:glycerophosphoryl diester phosphodiesterase